MSTFRCALQYPREVLLSEGFPHVGKWNEAFFQNEGPITLELGCGKGEYTVALTKSKPQRNPYGVDIRGENVERRQEVEENSIANETAFLRAKIENIDKFSRPQRWKRSDHFPRPTDAESQKAAHVYTSSSLMYGKVEARRNHQP